MASEELIAERVIEPLEVEPGDSFEVTVVITSVSEEISPLYFYEEVPDGWEVTPIDNDGMEYQDAGNTWLLTGSITPASGRTVIYEVQVPEETSGGNYTITGLVKGYKSGYPIKYSSQIIGNSEVHVEATTKFTSTDWTQFQTGLYNNGVTSDRAPIQEPDENESWATYTYGVPGAYGIDTISPVVGDLVYTVTQGAVFAVDRTTGEINWTNEIVTGITSPLGAPAYGNGKLFVVAFGQVYAFEAIDGTELWNHTVNSDSLSTCQLNTPVTYEDGKIYFGEWLSDKEEGEGSRYYCYDENGNEIWNQPSSTKEGYYRAGAAIIKQYLVYPDDDLHITSRNKYDGTIVDEVDIADLFDIGETTRELRASVMYDPQSERLYTATEDGYCISIGLEDDGTFDSSDAHKYYTGKSTTTPTLYNNRVYVGTGSWTGNGEFYCLDADDLSLIWKYTPNGGVQASAVISTAYDDGDGEVYIYFTTNVDNGTVYCFKDYTGNDNPELQWTYEPPEEQNEYTLPGVTIKDGRIFYGNDRGYLFGLAEWNPWDDPDSDEGEAMTTSESQEAIHYWLNSESAPVTGSIISTDRLQQLLHNWVEA